MRDRSPSRRAELQPHVPSGPAAARRRPAAAAPCADWTRASGAAPKIGRASCRERVKNPVGGGTSTEEESEVKDRLMKRRDKRDITVGKARSTQIDTSREV